MDKNEKDRIREEKERALSEFEYWWEKPIRILGVVWLLLLIFEWLIGTNSLIVVAIYVVWGIFILDFSVRLFLASSKSSFLKRNSLDVVSLMIPAFRFLRPFMAVKIAGAAGGGSRGLRLVSMISSLNRGMRSVREFLGYHKAGFVIVFSLMVAFAGSAGMYTFERGYPGSEGFETWGDSFWWTSMIMTTIGSQYWPVSPEGRLLCVLISLYTLGVFGYITAVLASFFVGKAGK